MSQHLFQGSFPALPTPFIADHNNQEIDKSAFEKLIHHHINNGSHGLVPTGTTGESPTLSFEEHFAVIDMAVQINQKKLPIVAGTGANSTQEAIEVTQKAQKLGVDAALIVAPYYNRPTQEGIYQHFKAIHNATDLPIFLYNVPGRTASDITPETTARLYELPRIIGIKDATGDVERISYLRHLCGHDLVIFSGEDGSAIGAAAHGADGCISVTANAAPALCAQFQNALLAQDFVTALKIQDTLYPLHKALFKEPNPVAIKTALNLLGIMSDNVRLPLVKTSQSLKTELTTHLKNIGLL
ncbi:MAG: 4-hydroxy-tetrahydrodipicolinate synthase [Alphaproteobacteria bacterium]|jgi:4-hydroxy-tetrahydrodipicolinate synthase